MRDIRLPTVVACCGAATGKREGARRHVVLSNDEVDMTVQQMTFGCVFSSEACWNIKEFASRAEDLGFDRVVTGEHVMDGTPPQPTLLSLPVVAAAAGATKTLRTMTGIVIAPLYHPVLLAKLVSTVDVISDGRLDLGIGISGQRGTRVEYDAMGIPVETRGRRVNEMIQVMKRLWTEEEVTHHGEFFDFEGITLLPRPVQKPFPPIWVAGRSDAAMRRAATEGDGWYPYLFTVRRLQSSMEIVKNYANEAGRDLTGFHWGVLQPMVIGVNRVEALAMAVAKVGERYATPKRGAEDIAQALCIAGTAKDCIRGIEERVEVGVRDFDLMLLAEGEEDLYCRMERFARLVLPHFRQ